jgi:GNAT superfamily N-acetyltransferase
MSKPINYVDFDESVTEGDLGGLLAHWDFAPPRGTLLRIMRSSSVVILAREPGSSIVCGYVTALTDHVACTYVSALEVRPEHRKQGIGMALLNKIVGRIDVYGTYLSCAPAMVPFYESAGFKRVQGMAKRRAPA